jgi:hypothetical protein
MTKLYVYGIVGATHFSDKLPNGHDEAPVFAIVSGDLAVAVSSLERSAVEVSAENVWLHENVLSALMERHSVLPMRFGTISAGAAQLLGGIVKRRGQLMKDLARLDGKVEIALRISGKNREKVEPRITGQIADSTVIQGAAYLQEKQQNLYGSFDTQSSVQCVRRAIRSQLDPLIVEAIWPTDEPQMLPFRASCLIKKNDVARFVQVVDDVVVNDSDTRVTCTGPWAPYSFVGQSGSETET